jgi:Na+-driven multidrug efflux pump
MSCAQQAARRDPPDTSTRAFVKLAWPLFIANLAVVGNGTIDTIMAGQLSATDLAAVAVGSSIYVSVYMPAIILARNAGARSVTICSRRSGFRFS